MGRKIFSRFCLAAVLAYFEVHHVRLGTAATAEAMTVPPRHLAGLCPWLLMAALQVVMGQPGIESERPALRAVIKVALLNQEPTGKPIILEGVFVRGSVGQAEGKLMQVRCHKGGVSTAGLPILPNHLPQLYCMRNMISQVARSRCRGTSVGLFPMKCLFI